MYEWEQHANLEETGVHTAGKSGANLIFFCTSVSDYFYDGLNVTNPVFSDPSQVFIKSGTKSNMNISDVFLRRPQSEQS